MKFRYQWWGKGDLDANVINLLFNKVTAIGLVKESWDSILSQLSFV